MASAAGDRVTFEVSFRENHQIGSTADLCPININFDGCKKNIEVRVDSTFRDGREHLLTIHTRMKDVSPETPWNENRYIRVSKVMVSSLSLTTIVPSRIGTIVVNPKVHIGIEAATVVVGKTHRIQIVNGETGLVARIIEVTPAAPQQNAGAVPNDFQRRLHNMGSALVQEGLRNLELAAGGGAPVFNASSTNADVFAHGMQGIVRAGQQMHPDIQVPDTRPSEKPADLDKLSVAELQRRFEEAYTQDKRFESQRIQAAQAGDMVRFNELMKDEMQNSELVVMLAEALERKGVKAQIPQNQQFRAAAQQSVNDHLEVLANLESACNQQ